jgi:hypothetical protein
MEKVQKLSRSGVAFRLTYSSRKVCSVVTLIVLGQ